MSVPDLSSPSVHAPLKKGGNIAGARAKENNGKSAAAGRLSRGSIKYTKNIL